ncbi:hypothetical protein RGQ21_65850 [Kitasatospora aureofaciens]|nr:hypothetical protein RGQ21_65850 [Kitasatospora aureofaciens]GHA76986.1 hypothetical protein GCM10010330_32890 [Streptomyces tendae]
MQDGVAEEAEGTDAPVGARDGALSHGGQSKVPVSPGGTRPPPEPVAGAAIRECEWISIG